MTRAPSAIALAAILALALTACEEQAPLTHRPPEPVATQLPEDAPVVDEVTSIAVVGDSITLGVHACPGEDVCASGSWATGDDPRVGSLRDRARAQNPGVTVEAFARSGARMSAAAAAGPQLVDADPGLAIVLLGANDACARRVEGMTSPEDFRAQLTTLLEALATAPGRPYVLVMSVPDLQLVWEALHDENGALKAWAANPSCQSLFADAGSTTADAVERRAQVADRVDAFNAIIGEVCGATPRCATDGGALHAHAFTRDEISPIDYFHPSLLGQTTISQLVWTALAAVPVEP
ncbi:GDSL-type esterase/lipase family protein [Protaetiibacter larvae]|uniref:SGNH hydrolase-type esterase domain-containing protein n=1 Tax=Protaetiibacter larvae TaxID=2592654 RepID=A0A5C1Y9A6_9MICO|nr:GDSL-type esterase/lipase family protein [Protaetiibacter larvae]QEO10260.1 hypothetical protein FLP23_09725 [Protaetiibacter larvae]